MKYTLEAVLSLALFTNCVRTGTLDTKQPNTTEPASITIKKLDAKLNNADNAILEWVQKDGKEVKSHHFNPRENNELKVPTGNYLFSLSLKKGDTILAETRENDNKCQPLEKTLKAGEKAVLSIPVCLLADDSSVNVDFDTNKQLVDVEIQLDIQEVCRLSFEKSIDFTIEEKTVCTFSNIKNLPLEKKSACNNNTCEIFFNDNAKRAIQKAQPSCDIGENKVTIKEEDNSKITFEGCHP